jgi:hypothetical protein
MVSFSISMMKNYFLFLKMSDVLESKWFKVSVLLFSGLAIAYSTWELSIAIRLKNYIKTNPNTTAISSNEVNWSFWVSIIILVIAIIFFVWAIIKLVFSRKYREEKVEAFAKWWGPDVEEEEGEGLVEKKTIGKKPNVEVTERIIRPCDEGVAMKKATRRVGSSAVKFGPPRSISSLYPED